MVKVAGRFTRTYFAGFDISGNINTTDVTDTADTPDVSAEGDNKKSYVVGQSMAGIACKGFINTDANTAHQVLSSRNGSVDMALVTFGPLQGDPGAAGSAMILDKYEGQVAVSGAGQLDSSFKNNNAPGLDWVKVLSILGTYSGPDAALQDGGASPTTLGLRAYLQQTGIGLGTPMVKVQHSADGSTAWADLVTFTPVAGRSAQAGAAAGTVQPFLRDTVTGGTGVFVVATRRL